jgi:hypothetical protein
MLALEPMGADLIEMLVAPDAIVENLDLIKDSDLASALVW